MLTFDDVAVRRGEDCLFAGLSQSLAPGQMLQVSGANGAGKTTLLAAAAGLLPCEQGRILWQGEDIGRCRSDYATDMSYIGHAAGLKMALSPFENLEFLLALRGLRRSRTQLRAALAEVGLVGEEYTPLARLSAGQKRRVALARLRLEESRLWVLDEPFTAIDRDGVSALEERLVQHAGDGGMVLFTTHHVMPARPGLQLLDLTAYRVQVAA